jgi:plasmid stability protein
MEKASTITVRRVPDAVKRGLRLRAAAHGHSLEEEVRQILARAAERDQEQPLNFARAIEEIIDPVGGIELDIPERNPMRAPPSFDATPEGEPSR